MNDVGYMQRVDVVNTHALLMYDNQDTLKYTREIFWWFGKYQAWNFGKDLISNGAYGNWQITLKNYWYVFGGGGYDARTLDDRKTRGGPVAITPSDTDFSLGIGNDNRKKVFFETSAERFHDSEGGFSNAFNFTTTYRPTPAMKFSFTPSFQRSATMTQYVTTLNDPSATATYGHRYIFARIDQHILGLETRADWTVNSRLSLQLYVQPYIASGGYNDYKYLTRPRAEEYTPLTAGAIAYEPNSNSYFVRSANGTFGNPNFNFRSVRGSAVVRWEFRPGSALYVVWNENRADEVPNGDFRLRRDLAALPSALSKDVFLVKVSYWLPM